MENVHFATKLGYYSYSPSVSRPKLTKQAQANLKGLCWHFTNFNQSFTRQKSLSFSFLLRKKPWRSIFLFLYSLFSSPPFSHNQELSNTHNTIASFSGRTSSTPLSPPQVHLLLPLQSLLLNPLLLSLHSSSLATPLLTVAPTTSLPRWHVPTTFLMVETLTRTAQLGGSVMEEYRLIILVMLVCIFLVFFFEDPFVWLLRKWRGRKLKFESCGIICFFQDPFVWLLRKWREEERNFESCGMFLFSWFCSCLLFTDPMFGHWEKGRKYNKFWSYGYFLFWLLL